ncbi:MAG: NADH:ubiquinone reductase (Na(+)-transporting) subunit B [Deltaproteobacteria bacterium]|nr:NADH:ubiquinone reductase (Na(+)-transporting) subunit B [Deltaproteobacteria bacterium]
MKLIADIFEKSRPLFEEEGKLARWFPLFEATESFFFIPGLTTKRDAHVRDSLDVKRFMSFVILALLPPFLFGVYNAGHQASLASGLSPAPIAVFLRGIWIVLPLVIISYGVGFFWEILFAVVRKHPISEGLLVTGLLFPLTLPPTIPLWQAAVGMSFGVVIGKEVFGGTGRNILNPALTGRAFLFFAYPGNMSGDAVWMVVEKAKAGLADVVSGATPLAIAGITGPQEKIESALDAAGYPFIKLLLGNYPGSIGATSALLCLAGAVLLVIVGIASYRIIAGGILGALATGFFLNFVASGTASAWFTLNPFYHLVMGGFAFGIAYMATDPVTAPGMDKSKWVYGFLIGMLTVLIRIFNPAYPEGIMLAILFMNLFSPLFDHLEIKMKLKKRVVNV